MAEGDKAYLGCKEGPEWTVGAYLELGTKQAVDRPGAGLEEIRRAARRSRGGDVALEVVSHFGFQRDVGMNVEAHPPTYADIINGRIGLAEAEIIYKGTDLEMIIGEPGTLRHHH